MSKSGKVGAVFVGVALVAGLGCTVKCIEKIPAGYVGVVYNMRGGVEDEILHQGWNLLAPTKKAKEFTIGNEQIVLSKDSREGSEEDESFAVATSDNANIDISFQMSYRFDESCVVKTYKNFKGMDGDDIVNTRVRTVLKSKVSETTTNYSMMDLYSGNREKINRELTQHLNEDLHKQFGIEVISASIIDVHPDAALQKTINDRVAAVQAKQKAQADKEKLAVENETKIQQAEALARENQIKAEAEAEVARVKAESKAEIIRIQAEAEAEANRKIAQSLTPELIEKSKLDKWNGVLPQISGDATPIINMTK